MPRLPISARIAATSILLLSLAHIVFWTTAAFLTRSFGLNASPNAILPVGMYFIAGAGFGGVVVAVGIFKARNWARIATLVLGALTAFICALALVILFALIAKPIGFSPLDSLIEQNRRNFDWLALIYLSVFLLAIWWVVLFSRKGIAERFSAGPNAVIESTVNIQKCPPPIALLAWLMIISGALSAISWPLIFGKIPAMLFMHIFSAQASQLIWSINTLLFLICGIGLLKLRRWSYTGTIALHIFWLVSLFVTQLSPLYNRYLSLCLVALSPPNSYFSLGLDRLPQWVSASLSAVPTALLIAGLFYYRPTFLKAAQGLGERPHLHRFSRFSRLKF
jgi:hypothetical protein